MRLYFYTFIRKAAAALLLTAAGTLPILAAESGTPQSIIHPEWEYTYYNNFLNAFDGELSVYQKCAFTDEKEIDGKNYWIFTLLSQTDKDNTTTEKNMPLAYMREENGKVYMRQLPDSERRTDYYCHFDMYGSYDREIMIYDFNLKTDESYQIGNPDEYPTYTPDPETGYNFFSEWMGDIEYSSRFPYAYLIMWDDGRMSVADVREDEASGRRVWFIHQKCTSPQDLAWPCEQGKLLDELDTDFDTTGTRTFRFVEGIGCLKSFLPFPGLYPPTFQCQWIGFYHKLSSPMLCEVTDKTTGETIYKDESRPIIPSSVEEIGAESENAEPKYYTLQGIRVLNPAPGEICIVRRGAKVTKEVIAR